jgi:hypothetical protein
MGDFKPALAQVVGCDLGRQGVLPGPPPVGVAKGLHVIGVSLLHLLQGGLMP